MKPKSITILLALLVAVTGLAAGCSTTPTLDTRMVEERYFGVGYARQMFTYGENLLQEGRYQEAMQAFSASESTAYVYSLREAARARRMWLEQAIAAYEQGKKPPPLPKINIGEPEAPPPAKPAPATAQTAPQTAATGPRLVPLTPAPPPAKASTTSSATTDKNVWTALTPPADRKARSLTESGTSDLTPIPKQ